MVLDLANATIIESGETYPLFGSTVSNPLVDSTEPVLTVNAAPACNLGSNTFVLRDSITSPTLLKIIVIS